MNANHIYERASKAAGTVDPMILASALDHIAKTAAQSRTQTRRLRWIKIRAEFALEGREYRDIEVDLPKDGGPATAEKLKLALGKMKLERDELLAALSRLKLERDELLAALREASVGDIGALGIVRAAIAKATGSSA